MITPKIIKNYIEQISNIEDISIKSRKTEIVFMRYVYYKLTYDFCRNYRLRQVGEYVGGQNHATVIHARKTFDELKDQDVFIESMQIYDKAYKYFVSQNRNKMIEDKLKELDEEKRKLINQIHVNEPQII